MRLFTLNEVTRLMAWSKATANEGDKLTDDEVWALSRGENLSLKLVRKAKNILETIGSRELDDLEESLTLLSMHIQLIVEAIKEKGLLTTEDLDRTARRLDAQEARYATEADSETGAGRSTAKEGTLPKGKIHQFPAAGKLPHGFVGRSVPRTVAKKPKQPNRGASRSNPATKR